MGIKTRIISFFWGFAEATFFFIVPDVWLSRLVIKDKKEAFINIVFATLGAVLGGLLIYSICFYYLETVLKFFTYIPSISDEMIAATNIHIIKEGFSFALLVGMINGIPYKIFAAWAATAQISIVKFIGISLLYRSLRFFIITILSICIASVGRKWMTQKTLYMLHGICWVVFYIYYFSVM